MDERPNSPVVETGTIGRLFSDYAVSLLAVLVIMSTAVAFWKLNKLQDQLIATLAEQGARLQSETLEEFRGLYTSEVVEKVRGHGIDVSHD